MALLNGFKETETEQQYRRGEIYYINNASKEHVGSEMKKDRPAVIVSCDANNKHSDVLRSGFPDISTEERPSERTLRSGAPEESQRHYANSRLRCLWRESTTSSVRHQRRKWSRLTLHS